MVLEKIICVMNETGIHARPAAVLVRVAMKYRSDIIIVRSGNEYDAKSIMNVMSMGVRKGETIHLKVSGPDEEEAFQSITALIENDFKEA